MVDFDWAGLELDWTGQDWAGWTGLDWIGLDSNESGLDQVRASSVPLLVGGVDRMRNGDGDGDGNWEPLDLPGSRGGRVDRRCRWILGGQRERGHWLVGRDDAAQNRGREGRQDTARQLRVGYVGRAGEVAQVRQVGSRSADGLSPSTSTNSADPNLVVPPVLLCLCRYLCPAG